MGTMQDLRARLAGGATPGELLLEGFSKSSIYAARQGLKAQTRRPGARKPGARKGPNGQARGEVRLPASVANDGEIVALQKKVAKAKLEAELGRVRGRSTLDLPEEVLVVYRLLCESHLEYAGSLSEFLTDVVKTWLLDHGQNCLPTQSLAVQWLLDWAEGGAWPPSQGARQVDSRSLFWEKIRRLNGQDW